MGQKYNIGKVRAENVAIGDHATAEYGMNADPKRAEVQAEALYQIRQLIESSRGIFLNYRRADAAPYARLLQSELRQRFTDVEVFMDLDSIEAGLDFAEAIRQAVGSCAVLVALIGRQWATLTDEQGRRRLDDPDDYVRFEIQTALERGVRVIPVLVDGAKPLRREQLPAGLHKLMRLNALELSYSRYEYDAGRLLDLIQRVFATVSGAGAVSESSPTRNEPPNPLPTKTGKPRRSPTSPGHWQPPTRTGRNASLNPLQ
jgi:hypothetical protein